MFYYIFLNAFVLIYKVFMISSTDLSSKKTFAFIDCVKNNISTQTSSSLLPSGHCGTLFFSDTFIVTLLGYQYNN